MNLFRSLRFAAFARKACSSAQTITIRMDDATALIDYLGRALARNEGLDLARALSTARQRVGVACPRCGPYSDGAKSIVLGLGKGGALEFIRKRAAEVHWGGPNAQSLSEGRCPLVRRKTNLCELRSEIPFSVASVRSRAIPSGDRSGACRRGRARV